MTTRIGTYGATQGYVAELMAIQTRMQTEQSQVSTGLKSTSYSGIAADAADVLNLNSQLTLSQQFVTDNSIASTKLTAASDAVSSIQTTIQNFNHQLNTFMDGNTKDPASIATLQSMAFQSLQSMQDYLGSNIGGNYIFGGGRVSTNPVQFSATSLQQFQTEYNGTSTTYPTSRSTDLASFNIGASDTGPLTVNADGSITAANSKAFLNVPVGSTITLGGLVPPTPLTITGVTNTATTIQVAKQQMMPETETSASIIYGGTTVNATGSDGTAATGTGNLSITSVAGGYAITPATAGSLAGLTPGTIFTMSGTTSNNGTYVVASNNGQSVTISDANYNVATASSGDISATLTNGATSLTSTSYGSLSFGSNDAGQITIAASTPNAFVNGTVYPAGTTLTVTGSSPNGANDGQYTVLSNDGTTMAVQRKPPVPSTSSSGIVPTVSEVGATLTDVTTASTLNSAAYGTLTIGTNTSGQVTLSSSNAALGGLSAGDTISLAGCTSVGGATSVDNGTYKVLSNAGGVVTLANSTTVTPSISNTAPTINGTDYGPLTLGSSNGGTTGSLTITSANLPGALTQGQTITLAGLSVGASSNNGSFVVSSIVGNTLTLTGATPVVPAATTLNINGSSFGNLTFSSSNGNLTVSAANALSPTLAVGQTITVGGSTPSVAGQTYGVNDGTFVVTGINGTAMTLAAAQTAATPSVVMKDNGGAAIAYGALTFGSDSSGRMTLTASAAASVAAVAAGDAITIKGSVPNGTNDGTYIVAANNGNGMITLATTPTSITSGIQPTTSDQTATLTSTNDAGVGNITSAAGGGGAGGYGTLTIGTNAAGQMIVSASTAKALSNFVAGDTIKITHAPAGANDGTYTVQQVNGNTLTLTSSPPTVTASSWYKGDTLSISQPTSATGNVGVAVYASDPAFEKAIRAMAMIAQGAPNTPGGLAANQSRLKAASYLLNASLDNPGLGTPPPPLSGMEEVSNITSLSSQIGFNLANINEQTTSETQIQGFIQTRLGDIENEDPTTAITNLEADSKSMQASYQSLAQLFSLSLLNYIK